MLKLFVDGGFEAGSIPAASTENESGFIPGNPKDPLR